MDRETVGRFTVSVLYWGYFIACGLKETRGMLAQDTTLDNPQMEETALTRVID
jgi:hypothetical protein